MTRSEVADRTYSMEETPSDRERLAEVIRPWTLCDHGGSFDHGSDRAADALVPLIDTLLREQREGVAAAIEAINWRSDPSPEAVRNLAARIARTFGSADRIEEARDADHA
jgi:hypothetical protein